MTVSKAFNAFFYRSKFGKVFTIYRFVFYVKEKDYSKLTSIKDSLEEYIEGQNLRNEAVYFDFDPMNSF